MTDSINALIERQLRRWEIEREVATRAEATARPRPLPRPVITVSRQHGTHGVTVAERLAERFGYTLLHRDVIERIYRSTGYSRRLIEALDNKTRSTLQNWIDSVVAGQYVDEGDYVRGLYEIISTVAELGGAVVVGRGANFIIGPERGFHVSIVAPVEMRVRSLMERRNLTRAAAQREVEERDRERAGFIRKVYGRLIGDPLAYDLVVNEAGIPLEPLVHLIAEAAREKLERIRNHAPAHA